MYVFEYLICKKGTHCFCVNIKNLIFAITNSTLAGTYFTPSRNRQHNYFEIAWQFNWRFYILGWTGAILV